MKTKGKDKDCKECKELDEVKKTSSCQQETIKTSDNASKKYEYPKTLYNSPLVVKEVEKKKSASEKVIAHKPTPVDQLPPMNGEGKTHIFPTPHKEKKSIVDRFFDWIGAK